MALEKFIIEGGKPLKGEVTVMGSKNAALPILAATILADSPCDLGNVPRLRDVDVLARIMGELGVKIERNPLGRLHAAVLDESKSYAPYELVSMMRASFCVLGPLLAKRGYAKVSLPGGCAIGDRPVDLHLKGLRALGAEIKIEDLAKLLIEMGASIEGAGSHRIKIRGVRRLEGCAHDVIPDRIEAATLLMAAAATRGEVVVKNIDPTHLEAVFDKLREAGIGFNRNCKTVAVSMDGRPKEVELTTLPYPGFPTDLQAQMMALMCFGQGASVFTDGIYPERLHHVAELKRMGARILRVNNTCVVIGVDKLQGAPVMASDLRAGAALVIAALCAEGETQVRRIYHIDRGYENFEQKLRSLGAIIHRVPDEAPEKPPAV